MNSRVKILASLVLIVIGGYLLLVISFYPYYGTYFFVEYFIENISCSRGQIKFMLTTSPNILIPCRSISITKYPGGLDLVFIKDYNCSEENFYQGIISLYNDGACSEQACWYVIEYKGKPAILAINSTLCK